MSMLSTKYPCLIEDLRPSLDETEQYARLILEHEGRPASSLRDCQREAELQLWADRSFRPRAARRAGRRAAAAG